MLSSEEISTILDSLTKDFSIGAREQRFLVNKSVACSACGSISEFLAGHPDANEFVIDSERSFCALELVADFLNGQSVVVDFRNDQEVHEVASLLQVQSLLDLSQKSLLSPVTTENVLRRIRHNPESPEVLLNFIASNIASFSSDSELYTLPPSTLRILAQSTSFSSVLEKYRFIFRCFLRYPHFMELEEEIPEAVICEVATSEEFVTLEGKFSCFSAIEKLFRENEELSAKLAHRELEISEMQESINQLHKEIGKSFHDRFPQTESVQSDLSMRLSQISQELIAAAYELQVIGFSESMLDELQRKLVLIKGLFMKLDDRFNDIGRQLLYMSVGSGVKFVKHWGELIEKAQTSLNEIIPTEDDVNDLIQELRHLSMELQRISLIDFARETNT
jgi:prefoldin subunit 5